MKRDWEIIRAILLAVEEKPPNVRADETDVPNYPKEIVREHIRLLSDAGYIDAKVLSSSFIAEAAIIRGITLTGYDLLDTIRSNSLWEKIKTTAQQKGLELTFDVVKQLGVFALKSIISN